MLFLRHGVYHNIISQMCIQCNQQKLGLFPLQFNSLLSMFRRTRPSFKVERSFYDVASPIARVMSSGQRTDLLSVSVLFRVQYVVGLNIRDRYLASRYDTIQEFNADSKAECDQFNPYPGSWGVKCPQSTFASVAPKL